MRDALLVSGGHGFRHGDPDREHTVEWQAAGRQHVGQRTPFHQFHRQEDGRADVFHGVDGDDVRVVERRHGVRLARESLAAIGIGSGDVRAGP